MKKLDFIAFITLLACSAPTKKPVEIEEVSLGVTTVNDYPEKLSEWNLFGQPMANLIPINARVIPYEINAALFSDYAHKARFIQLPEGKPMEYHDAEVMNFPVSTVLIKNFFYPSKESDLGSERRILETRLLIREEDGWKAIVYEWNEEQTEATRLLLGATKSVNRIDEQGVIQQVSYTIPSQPQCKSCHDLGGEMTPIGPSARQLNKNNQLSDWISKGFLAANPDQSFPRLVDYNQTSESLNLRARAWLEVNCAHCHRREGPAKNSGLYLLASQSDPYRLGVNKPPIAAGKGSGGLKHSIVPGAPDESILVHRISSLEPGEMMPELGRSMNHEEGVRLISDWIRSMEP